MKVQFVKKTDDCIVQNVPNDTFIIYKKGYDLPTIKGVNDAIEFTKFKEIGEEIGIKRILSGPLVRSSYHASEIF